MGQQQIFFFFFPPRDNDGTVITEKASNLQSVGVSCLYLEMLKFGICRNQNLISEQLNLLMVDR